MGRQKKNQKRNSPIPAREKVRGNAVIRVQQDVTPASKIVEGPISRTKHHVSHLARRQVLRDQRTDEEIAFERHLVEIFADFMETQPQIATEAINRAKVTPSERIPCWLSDLDGLTLLAAVRHNRVDLAAIALLRGADPNRELYEEGLLPIHAAARLDHAHTLRLLLEQGALADAPNAAQETALYLASRANGLDSVNALVKHGADVNARNLKGETPLHAAAMNASVNVMAVLVKAGACVNAIAGSEGVTPLDLAIKKVETSGKFYLDRVKFLTKHGATLSHWNQQKLLQGCRRAISAGVKDLVELYLDSGCNPNKRTGTNTLTLLGIAADLGHVEIGELLLSRGACPRGDPPVLLVALCSNHPPFVDLLLKRGTDAGFSDQEKKRCMRLAAIEGDRESAIRRALMKVLVRNGLSIDMPVDSTLNTVLHRAVKYQVDSIELLMDLGADINAQNCHGATPLILACQSNNLKATKIILRSGKADLFCTTLEGSTALHEAVTTGCKALLEILLFHGAPVYLPREDGMTPLDLAIETVHGHGTAYLSLVALLVQHGATLEHWTSHQLFIKCYEAVMEEIEYLVELYLMSGCDPNTLSEHESLTLLGVAAYKGYVGIASLLVDYGAAMTSNPPLFVIALRNGHVPFMNFLLERRARGYDLEVNDRACTQAIAFNVDMDYKSKVAMFRVLFENGVDINAVGGMFGDAVLHEVVEVGDIHTIRLLVGLGADVNVRDSGGLTPLMLACYSKNYRAAKVLIESGGANLHCTAQDGSHILHEAVQQGAADFVNYLLREGAPVDLLGSDGLTPLELAIMESNVVIAELLLDAGADVSRNGGALLNRAIIGESLRFLCLLLSARVNVNQVDNDGRLPLSVACECNAKEFVKLLLDAGAAANGTEEAVERPLMAAIRSNASRQIIQMLLDAGADISTADPSCGRTLLHSEALKGRTEIAAFLLQQGAQHFNCSADSKDTRKISCASRHTEVAGQVSNGIPSAVEDLNGGFEQSPTREGGEHGAASFVPFDEEDWERSSSCSC